MSSNKKMLKSNIVTISRYWNNPEIATIITSEDISLSITLKDFLLALKLELGSVAWIFTKNTFNDKFDKAVTTVLERVKEESVKAI